MGPPSYNFRDTKDYIIGAIDFSVDNAWHRLAIDIYVWWTSYGGVMQLLTKIFSLVLFIFICQCSSKSVVGEHGHKHKPHHGKATPPPSPRRYPPRLQ